MKRSFRSITLLVMCFSCVACQTTPKTKPLTEMTDDEKRAVYMNGPITAPKKEHHALKTTLAVAGTVLVVIPIIILTSIARPGNQIHMGK